MIESNEKWTNIDEAAEFLGVKPENGKSMLEKINPSRLIR